MPRLPNGTVLPHGILGNDTQSMMAGFNKTYRNNSLRMGIVIREYPVTDDNNRSKLATEYDVLVFEQVEDRGSTTITYKNCLSSEGFGSIPDFFEASLRVKEVGGADNSLDTKDQNGAVVLLLCLDGISEKAIIIGGVNHPDRKTTVVEDTPRLEGEFNGVNIKIEQDGSTSLEFNGATDNDGEIIDDSQGKTKIAIEKDGSFQVDHDAVTIRLDRKGVVTITAKDDLNISCKNAKVTASENVNANCVDATITASGTATVEGQTVKLGAGAAEAVIKGDTFKKMVFDVHIHPTPIGPSGPPSQPMAPSSLSTKVKTE